MFIIRFKMKILEKNRWKNADSVLTFKFDHMSVHYNIKVKQRKISSTERNLYVFECFILCFYVYKMKSHAGLTSSS